MKQKDAFALETLRANNYPMAAPSPTSGGGSMVPQIQTDQQLFNEQLQGLMQHRDQIRQELSHVYTDPSTKASEKFERTQALNAQLWQLTQQIGELKIRLGIPGPEAQIVQQQQQMGMVPGANPSAPGVPPMQPGMPPQTGMEPTPQSQPMPMPGAIPGMPLMPGDKPGMPPKGGNNFGPQGLNPGEEGDTNLDDQLPMDEGDIAEDTEDGYDEPGEDFEDMDEDNLGEELPEGELGDDEGDSGDQGDEFDEEPDADNGFPGKKSHAEPDGDEEPSRPGKMGGKPGFGKPAPGEEPVKKPKVAMSSEDDCDPDFEDCEDDCDPDFEDCGDSEDDMDFEGTIINNCNGGKGCR